MTDSQSNFYAQASSSGHIRRRPINLFSLSSVCVLYAVIKTPNVNKKSVN